jgi:hypothetical protein
MMEAEVIVIGANRYSFKDDAGRIVEGTKVHYFEPVKSEEEDYVGYTPQSANLPYSAFDSLGEVPGRYLAIMSVSLRGRKPMIRVEGFRFVEPVIL